MARVPAYNEPRVAIRNTPEVRMAPQRIEGADAEAFGAGAGRDMQRGAQLIGVAYDEFSKEKSRQQEIEDADQIFDKKNKFRADLLSVHEQVKARQGSNAKGAAEWADGETQKIRDKYLGELGNDQQKKIFMQDAESIRLNTRESATAWERQQLDAGLDAKWESAKELAVSHASADPNPKNIAAIEAELQRSNAFQAQRKGWDAETLQNETRKDLTKLHSGVFSQIMAAEDIGGAQTYLNTHRDKLNPEVVARADKWIRGKALDAYSTKVADQFIAEGASFADAWETVDKKYKGEDKDKVMSKLRERYGDSERMKRERMAEAAKAIDREAYDGGGMYAVSDASIERQAIDDPAGALESKTKKAKEQENLADRGTRFAKKTNYDTMDVVNKLIASGDIRDPEQLDKFAGDLSEGDYKSMRHVMTTKSQIEPKDVLKAYTARADIKDNASMTEDQTAEYSAFLQTVTGYVNETSRGQDLDALADKFFIDKHNKHTILPWNKKEFQRNAINEDAIGSEERRNQGLLNSSDPKVQEAQNILRQNGKKITPDSIIKLMQRLEK